MGVVAQVLPARRQVQLVVGVVENARQRLDQPPGEEIYFPLFQSSQLSTRWLIRSSLPAALLEERARLIKEIRSLESRTFAEDEEDTQKPGFSMQLADSASENIEMEISLNIHSMEAKTLMEIEDALRAMERGDYGFCKGSGEPIELDRLRVKPWARYSVKYLRDMENQGRRGGSL